jgi:hypothetical protein
MDSSQLIILVSRLAIGAVACFLAILLWARTRDIAWMFIVFGTIASYADIVYGILHVFGIRINSVAFKWGGIFDILLPILPGVFYILAFSVMISRKYRK